MNRRRVYYLGFVSSIKQRQSTTLFSRPGLSLSKDFKRKKGAASRRYLEPLLFLERWRSVSVRDWVLTIDIFR